MTPSRILPGLPASSSAGVEKMVMVDFAAGSSSDDLNLVACVSSKVSTRIAAAEAWSFAVKKPPD